MSKDKKKILLLYRKKSRWVKDYANMLQNKFDIKNIQYKSFLTVPKIIFHIIKADVVLSWFAGRYATIAAVVAKIFKKKSIVIVGGYEVAYEPEVGYGARLFFWGKFFAKIAIRLSDCVISVSEHTKKEVLQFVKPRKIKTVCNAVDVEKFSRGDVKKEDIVVTVGDVSSATIKNKGLETFVLSAEHLPNVKFYLIGRLLDDSYKKLKILPNVTLIGYLQDAELISLLRKAKVYCQLSWHESFGLALAEAMACECVPVVTERAALPEVVGDTGFYVPYGDQKATAEAIKEALMSDKGKLAGERVKELFSIEKRKDELVNVIINLTKGGE